MQGGLHDLACVTSVLLHVNVVLSDFLSMFHVSHQMTADLPRRICREYLCGSKKEVKDPVAS